MIGSMQAQPRHRRDRHARSVALGLYGVMSLAPLPASAADWVLDAAAELRANDNLPHARRRADAQSDVAFQGRLGVGRYFQLDERTGLFAHGQLASLKHQHFGDLDRVDTGLDVDVIRKLGLGATVPRLSAGFSVTRESVASDQRDAWLYATRATLSRRFSTRLDVSLLYEFERRRADRAVDIPSFVQTRQLGGDVFDTDGHTLGLGASYDLTARLSVLIDYSHRIGDIVSTSRTDSEVVRHSLAIAPDRAFGEDRIAYRLDADTDLLGATLSWALGDFTSLNLGYRFTYSHLEDIRYEESRATLTLLYQY